MKRETLKIRAALTSQGLLVTLSHLLLLLSHIFLSLSSFGRLILCFMLQLGNFITASWPCACNGSNLSLHSVRSSQEAITRACESLAYQDIIRVTEWANKNVYSARLSNFTTCERPSSSLSPCFLILEGSTVARTSTKSRIRECISRFAASSRAKAQNSIFSFAQGSASCSSHTQRSIFLFSLLRFGVTDFLEQIFA
jgi:hypothetical protein